MAAYALETVSSLPFGMLIGAPLSAGVEAQSQAAKATIDFIREVGFKPADPNSDPLFPLDNNGNPRNDDADFGDVRVVTFKYQTTNGAGEPGTATLTVPVLTVVPIPYFSIDEMTIDFVAKITESITSTVKAEDNRRKDASATVSGGWGPVRGGLKASYSSSHTSTSEKSSKYNTELAMTIHVRATSESMPKGLARVLDILASGIKQKEA
jgi:uncharacterized protein DUF2589